MDHQRIGQSGCEQPAVLASAGDLLYLVAGEFVSFDVEPVEKVKFVGAILSEALKRIGRNIVVHIVENEQSVAWWEHVAVRHKI